MAPQKQKSLPLLSPSAFAHTQLSLLAQEQAAEIAETTLLLSDSSPTVLARAGVAILNLTISSQHTGLGGKTVLEFALDPAIAGGGDGELPEHGIRVGDVVRVGEQPSGGSKKKDRVEMKGDRVEGVVTKVREKEVAVAVGKDNSSGDEDGEVPEGKRLWLYVVAQSNN